jgi:hypothetical protein
MQKLTHEDRRKVNEILKQLVRPMQRAKVVTSITENAETDSEILQVYRVDGRDIPEDDLKLIESSGFVLTGRYSYGSSLNGAYFEPKGRV